MSPNPGISSILYFKSKNIGALLVIRVTGECGWISKISKSVIAVIRHLVKRKYSNAMTSNGKKIFLLKA